MSGYSSTYTKLTGQTIEVADFTAEFNQLTAAFVETTGHKHDGTADEGPVIDRIGDAGLTAPLNKILVHTALDEIGFYVDVASVSEEQFLIQDGVIVPKTDNDVDLGSTTVEFKDLFIDGTAHIDTLDVDENATVVGNLTVQGTLGTTGLYTATNLTVTGNTILGDAATDTVTITADIASTLIPSADNTYDIGAVGSEWKDVYINGVAYLDSVDLAGTVLTVTGTQINQLATNTFTSDVTIDKASPSTLTIDTLTNGACVIDLQENSVNSLRIWNVPAATAAYITKYESDGITTAATIQISDAGVIDVTVGTLNYGSVEVVNLSKAQTLTNKTLTSPVIGTSVSGTAILDEDTLVSDSATQLATQQSIKAYSDNMTFYRGFAATATAASVLTSSIVLTSTTATIVEDWDDDNWFTPATGEFNPNISGYYHIDFSATLGSVTAGVVTIVRIYKNATPVAEGSGTTNITFNSYSSTSADIYFNGTTDYIALEVRTYTDTSWTLVRSRFSAHLLKRV